MVKDFKIPKAVSSFAKIPGTGLESSTAILCDLSIVANISLANPLPKNVVQSNKPEEKSISSKPVQVKRLQIRNSGLINSYKLLEEKNRLVLKNRELNKKLSIFKALFKNRTQLNAVLAKLDEKPLPSLVQ